jgi:hypothetical protein
MAAMGSVAGLLAWMVLRGSRSFLLWNRGVWLSRAACSLQGCPVRGGFVGHGLWWRRVRAVSAWTRRAFGASFSDGLLRRGS